MAATAACAISRRGKILVASSRPEYRANILKTLGPGAAGTTEAAGGADALLKLERGDFGTVLLDRELEDLDSEELVATIQSRYPALHVVLLGGATEAEQLPLELCEGEAAGAGEGAEAEAVEVPSACDPRNEPLPGMIGESRKIGEVYRLARLVAPRDTTVLIIGATGTGKELVARGIHDLSRRSRGPFVVVNCAAIPESLLEAELFGFTRGAFTGAVQSRLGRIHAAHGGTLLLDEVGELPLSMQAKLLRFVQEGEVQRLGSADLFRVDTRVIAATNADLAQRVREKQFREDLFYRLAVFPLDLPRLETRGDDVLPLAEFFLEKLCRDNAVPAKTIHPETAALLKRRTWPGNVRELQHAIERAFVLADGHREIRSEDLAMPAYAA